jgi:hypothetical protein
MLLQNLNQAESLCNVTRLVITILGDMIIEGQINSQREISSYSRISLTLKNNK